MAQISDVSGAWLMILPMVTLAIAMRPGQAELKKTLDAFIARHRADGELNKLYQKWLGTDLPALSGS